MIARWLTPAIASVLAASGEIMNVEIPEAEAGHQAREAARQLVERLRAHKAEVRS